MQYSKILNVRRNIKYNVYTQTIDKIPYDRFISSSMIHELYIFIYIISTILQFHEDPSINIA